MFQRLDDFREDVALKAGGSFLLLCIAPVLWAFLGLLLALINPAHGVFEWIHKLVEVWRETTEVHQKLQEGTFFGELGASYAVAFYFGIVVLSLLLIVAALSLTSRLLRRRWAAAVEATAAVIWLIPYWTYRVVASVMLFGASIAMTGGFCWGVIQVIRTSGWIAGIFGGLFGLGVLMVALPAMYVSFIVTLSPLYLCFRYVVPLGLICGQLDGFAGRRLKSAFAEGRHFPFWPAE